MDHKYHGDPDAKLAARQMDELLKLQSEGKVPDLVLTPLVGSGALVRLFSHESLLPTRNA